MSGFFESSKDTYTQQMEALEQMGQQEEAEQLSLGLMAGEEKQGMGDYVWDFVKTLRKEREPFTVEPQTVMLPEITDLDVEQFEQAVQGMGTRYNRDMVESLEAQRDMRTSRVVDVTDTPQGELTNPKPLYDMAKEIDPGTIETKELGLMSKPKEEAVQETKTELQTYTQDFAKGYLAEHEGTTAHKSLEGGKDTAEYGVKFSRGLKREDYNSNAEFAAAVALVHKDEVKAKFDADKWDELPKSVQYALVDLKYNTNTIGSTAKKADSTEMMKNTLEFVGMTTKAGEKASLISLAKRRAINWNKASSDIGASKISKVKQIPTSTGGTTFEYLDSDDNVVHSVTTSRTPVKLNKKGVATTLTETREITL